MPDNRQRGHSLLNSIVAEETAGRAMLVQTAAMFYSLRAMPMRRQLLLDTEHLHRQAWLTLRQSEIHALRAVGHMSQEYIRRQELLDQFLFERELLLEPQFIAFEEMTRKDIVRAEWGHRKYLFDFAVESRIMLHGEDWAFQDPDELIDHSMYDQHRSSDGPPSTDVTAGQLMSSSHATTPQAPAEAHPRRGGDDFDDLTSEVLDAMFVPSHPPSDRRGWVPGMESSHHSHHNRSSSSAHHHGASRNPQRQSTPVVVSPHMQKKPTRPSTASIYRHRDHVVESPRKSATTTTPNDRPPWQDRSAMPIPSRPSSARKPPSRMLLIRHASNRPNGDNHREQPYFTSHYCTPSPPAATSRGSGGGVTSRPISASRSAQRVNHGSPLLMLTGKHATIAQTKEMLKHMPLEEVERLVPMIRLPRLDLSYLATPSKVADREARRLFGPATSTTPARGVRPGSATTRQTRASSRGSGAESAPPIMSATACAQHRSHHSIFGEGPPLAFLSFSSPFPNSSLVTLPLESLVATLYALQVEQLTRAPDHIVRLLRQQFGEGRITSGDDVMTGDDVIPKKVCPWCVAEEHQRLLVEGPHTPVIAAPNASPPLPSSLQPPSTTISTGQQARTSPRSSIAHHVGGGTAVSSQRSHPPLHTTVTPPAADDRRNHSLREHLLIEFPFLRDLHADRDLCRVPIEVLDPQRDREFAAAAKQWKEIASQEKSTTLNGSLLSNPPQQLGRTPSFNHHNHHPHGHHMSGPTTTTAASSQHHHHHSSPQLELETRMRHRCVRMAQEYQRGRILETFPFVPATVDGVPIEELPLLDDAEFCRLAEAFAASESAGRIPTLKHEHRVQVGNVLMTARERFFSYLELFGRQYQERVLRSCCPQLYVTPPSTVWPGPSDREGHAAEWCAFRSCFALYASPAHTLGIWADKALHGHLMKVWNPLTNQPTEGTAKDQLKLFDLILAAARKRRKSLFSDAGLQARHFSWSTDELEPYLHASFDTTIPNPSDTLSIVRRALKRSSDTVVVMIAESVARYQHWVLTDCIPALIQQPTTSNNNNGGVSRIGAHHLSHHSSLAVQYLHQATRDIVDTNSTTMWWMQETGGGGSSGGGEEMTWDQYLAALPFLKLFSDAPFMNSCAAWMELHREHGALGDTQSDLQMLQQKLCRRAYSLANHWCVHGYEEREVHLKTLEAAEQRWHIVNERLLTQSLYQKRTLHLTAEEPLHRRQIQEAYGAHRAGLLYELSSHAAEEDLERYLQYKERWLFLSVAICRRNEFEHHVVTPALARLGTLATSLNHAANEMTHARLSVVQHEHVQRNGVEAAWVNSWSVELQSVAERERTKINKLLLMKLQQFEPLYELEATERRRIHSSADKVREELHGVADAALRRTIHLKKVSEALFRDEEAQRDTLARSLLREMAAVSESGEEVRAKALMKERRRSSINFHLAQARAVRGGLDASSSTDSSPIRRPGSFSQQRRLDPLTPSPRKESAPPSPLIPAPPTSEPSLRERDAAAAILAAQIAEHEKFFKSEESQRTSIFLEEGRFFNQFLPLAVAERHRIEQHLRDREILEKSAPFADIFGFNEGDALDNSALQVPKNAPQPSVDPESEDVRQRFFAATSKAQPIDKPYGAPFANEVPKRGAGGAPPTILRKGSSTTATSAAPSPSSGKRVKLRVGN